MSGSLLVRRKPLTKRGARILKEREPKLVEDHKAALLLYGGKTSQLVKDVLRDVQTLNKGFSVKLTHKNEGVRPLEAGGEVSLEGLARVNNCGLFVLGSHQKKRPNNLTLGRLYDGRLFDALELGIEDFKPINSFHSADSVQAQNKPCFVFSGDEFENVPEMRCAKSILLDLLRGRVVDQINLKGMQHVIFVTCLNKTILFRPYTVKLRKSGSKVPQVQLVPMGPSLDLAVRRFKDAPDDLKKQATSEVVTVKKKENKNRSMDLVNGAVGRVYVNQQDLTNLPTNLMKGTKRKGNNENSVARKKPQQADS